jgi:hypothetical protein
MSSQLTARDAIQQAKRLFRDRHAHVARRGHVYLPGEEMLLLSEHLSLRGEHPKFFPKFVGPFVIAELRGVNTVELQIPPQTRFGLIDTIVNIDRLRPYKQRPPQLHLSSRSCVESILWSYKFPRKSDRYDRQYRSPTALQATATSTRFI